MSEKKFDPAEILVSYRRVFILTFHVLAVIIAHWLAFELRFDWNIPDKYMEILPLSLAIALAVRLPMFWIFGLYKGLWRYASIKDFKKIILATFIGTAIIMFCIRGIASIAYFPRSVYFIDWMLITAIIGGARFTIRAYRDTASHIREGRKVLVIGAGNAGEMIVRDMMNSTTYPYEPIGFIDDDLSKKGLTIHGVPILGTRAEMDGVIKHHMPDEILIAIPSAMPGELHKLVKELNEYRLPIKTLPSIKAIFDGMITVSQIKNIELEDLLARPPVKADMKKLMEFINGKRIMVTGGGGSIGSEICRQVARLGAGAVIAYERHENSLYNLDMDFKHNMPDAAFFPVVGDINDRSSIEAALDRFKPDIIFHAAAHKHVPLMEINLMEAMKNNVLGTMRMASLAAEKNIGAFVFISTDKAVNPTSVMGATKRACEFVVRSLSEGSTTKFITVRFGNVLGSSGSVVPLFREQIKRGGPVTVTHPDINRFLMLIPEAVKLVLEAASIGEGGEIFVLDMGEPIRIADLARDLIIMSGYEPEKDIRIEYIGLRPGEKLFEELFDKTEDVAPTTAAKVNRAIATDLPNKAEMMQLCADIERLLKLQDKAGMLKALMGVVKTYTPQGFIDADSTQPKNSDQPKG